ncbi:MAG: type II CAAX prenyl endopeptidase Rce1 family protein [Caldicoprobacterales bacterium]|jgi:membrane protease YdiL (CAAX protease family)
MIIIYGSIVTPVYEELIFRGYIWNRFSKAMTGKLDTYIWNITLLRSTFFLVYRGCAGK